MEGELKLDALENLSRVNQQWDCHDFDARVSSESVQGLFSAPHLDTLQVNIGLICNLVCRHCHVNSSPRRKEEMSWETMEAVLRLAGESELSTIDITGGAPEMHPRFRDFVSASRDQNLRVLVRTNLTILLESGYESMPEFLARQEVELVASLPCYTVENCDRQRGDGVYAGSIEAIKMLNALGFGLKGQRVLNLVYNPLGPSLPPNEAALEADYRRELHDRFGIEFTRLITITNIPIGRFRADLKRAKTLDPYMDTLRNSFNAATVPSLMCRNQIHVGWDGTLYDCDFNFALHLPSTLSEHRNVHNVAASELTGRRIVCGDHCYACTAGAGSSCGGALT